MVTWTLEDKEAEFLLGLVAQRPLAEVVQFYGKLVAQVQAQKEGPRTADAAGGHVSGLNGSGAVSGAAVPQ